MELMKSIKEMELGRENLARYMKCAREIHRVTTREGGNVIGLVYNSKFHSLIFVDLGDRKDANDYLDDKLPKDVCRIWICMNGTWNALRSTPDEFVLKMALKICKTVEKNKKNTHEFQIGDNISDWRL